MSPIVIENLSKVYRGKKGAQVEALKGLSLTINTAEVVGFLGPNGAGKSTTIKTLMGQIRPTSGSVKLFGMPAENTSARDRIGYLPENPAFYTFLTAQEYLALVGSAFGMDKSSIHRETGRVLDLLDLTAAARRPIKGYSKGMVQRLGLAQALLHNPDLYVLDEPMSGLDPVGRALVKDLILDLRKQGKTIFFSTHVVADVEAICDRVAIVVQGELRAENTVDEITAAGITGYHVRLEQAVPPALQEFCSDDPAQDTAKLYVPRQKLHQFMRLVSQAGCDISLIEPKRKSLEDFFLKIIAK
jgi:ABC-2 type transport system ATP-binding protein